MSIDVNMVHNLASGLAAGERNAANQGKHVNQKGWVTKEQMRKDAAQKTIALLVLIFLATFIFKFLRFLGCLSIKFFGPKWGRVINVVGIVLLVFIPACTLKMVSDCSEDAAAKAAEAREQAAVTHRKQVMAKVEAYRAEIRVKVHELFDKCADDPALYMSISNSFERCSDVQWNGAITDMYKYATETIDRAYESCVQESNKQYGKRIADYVNTMKAKLSSVSKDARSRGHVERFERAVYRYTLGVGLSSEKFEEAKEDIEHEYQKCLMGIESGSW